MPFQERERTTRLHRAVRGALEENLTSREFLIGIRVHPQGQHPMLVPATELARRVDAWLSSLDPDTDDASELSVELRDPAVLLKVHAISKDPRDRDRRARPIVWNPEPLVVAPDPGGRKASQAPSVR